MYSNPYRNYTTLTDLSLYVVDTYVIQTIENSLTRIENEGKSRDLLITGEGGSGKTSLLTYIMDGCAKRNIFSVNFLLGSKVRDFSSVDFFEWIERHIVRSLREDHDLPNFRRLQDFWERLQSFSLSVGPINATADAKSVIAKSFVESRLPEDFAKFAQEILEATKKSGILLLLDDADEISPAIFETFRQVFPDRSKYTIFIVSGKTLFMTGAQMTLVDYNKRLLRPFQTLRIQALQLHQTEEMLMRPLYKASTPLWYDSRHIEIIHRIANGNPYIAYSLADFCFDYGRDGNQIRLTKYVVSLARDQLWGVDDNLKSNHELNQIISDELEAR